MLMGKLYFIGVIELAVRNKQQDEVETDQGELEARQRIKQNP